MDIAAISSKLAAISGKLVAIGGELVAISGELAAASGDLRQLAYMSSCSTRTHVFLFNKKTCLLVEQDMSSC